MSIDPIGPGRMRYKKKVDKARKKGIKRLRYAKLLKLKNGKKVPVRIPIYRLPKMRYGPWAPGVGTGPGEAGDQMYPGQPGDGKEAGEEGVEAIYGEFMTRDELVNWMKQELELEFIKPSKTEKKDDLKFPAISKRGDDSLLDLDETIEAMIERQIVQGDIKPDGGTMKIQLDEDDLRFRFPKIVWKHEKDAIVIFIRDVSGSITMDELEAEFMLTALVQIWLEECYPDVRVVYIAHNADAWEETEEGYYNLQSGGGTKFVPAFGIIECMFEGKDYPRKTSRPLKINPEYLDVFIVQMGDGQAFDNNESLNKLKSDIVDRVTRFCFMETKMGYSPSSSFGKLIDEDAVSKQDKVRVAYVDNIEGVWDAMKEFFGKGSSK